MGLNIAIAVITAQIVVSGIAADGTYGRSWFGKLALWSLWPLLLADAALIAWRLS